MFRRNYAAPVVFKQPLYIYNVISKNLPRRQEQLFYIFLDRKTLDHATQQICLLSALSRSTKRPSTVTLITTHREPTHLHT